MRVLYTAARRVDQRLIKALREFGHVVEVVQAAADGPEIARLAQWDVIIADAPAPLAAWLEQLSKACPDASLIAVGGVDAPQARVEAFRAGADAWFARPISVLELRARLDALARARQPTTAAASDGAVGLDPTGRTIRFGVQAVELTRHEYALMTLLMAHPSRIFEVADLLILVWGDEAGAGPAQVRQCISRLRIKLTGAGQQGFIETVRGHGYRLGEPKM